MKKIFLLFAFMLLTVVRAQTIEPLVYEQVVKVSDSSKLAKKIYSSAKIWFAKTYKNPKSVVQMDDLDNNTIIGNGSVDFTSKIFMGSGTRNGQLKYTITIVCKNGRYKYTVDNITHEKIGAVANNEIQPKWDSAWTGGLDFRKKVSKELRDYLDGYFNNLISTLAEEMNKTSATDEDW